MDDETSLVAGDVLILVGSFEGIERLRELAGIPPLDPPGELGELGEIEKADNTEQAVRETGTLGGGTEKPEKRADKSRAAPDVSRAADLLVEMKDLSGIAIDLAYSSLALGDRVLATEVRHLEARLDDMREQLELWVLQAAAAGVSAAELRGLLHLGTAAEDIGDQANQMIWTVEKGESHPILGIAIGDSADVAVRYPIRAESKAAGSVLGDLELNVEPGFVVLAVRRGDRYIHRPGHGFSLMADDEVIATGPNAGRQALSELFGWFLERDEETGEEELLPLEHLK